MTTEPKPTLELAENDALNILVMKLPAILGKMCATIDRKNRNDLCDEAIILMKQLVGPLLKAYPRPAEQRQARVDDIDGLEKALERAELWQPSPSAKMAYDDYNLFVSAARSTLQPAARKTEGKALTALDRLSESTVAIEPTVADDFKTIRTALASCASVDGWQDIETAPHETLVVLGWYEGDTFKQEIALASAGERFSNGYSNRWQHGQATHWMPLPTAPDPAKFPELVGGRDENN